ncbi:Alpha-latrocrustotoxin [Dactylella cylindrospora]|nr:Alpha-latrocrustotoxin [Dactylella cylindrospora]
MGYLELKEVKSILDEITTTTDKTSSQVERILQYNSREELIESLKVRRDAFNLTEAHKIYCQNLASQSQDAPGWLLRTSKYRQWRSTDRPTVASANASAAPDILYLEGDRGFGKTMQLFSAKQQLERSTRGEDSAMVHFFFKSGNEELQESLQALETLLCQLLDQIPNVPATQNEEVIAAVIKILDSPDRSTLVNRRFDDEKSENAGRESEIQASLPEGKTVNSVELFTNLIRLIVEATGIQLFVILDAMDECRDCVSKNLIPFLESMVRVQKGGVRILISTRTRSAINPLVHMSEVYESEGKIPGARHSPMMGGSYAKTDYIKVTKEKNGADLHNYIFEKIKPLVSNRYSGSHIFDSQARAIADEIYDKVNGDFSYASMVITNLQQPSRLSLKKRLNDIPAVAKMGDVYRKGLESLTAEQRSLVIFALRWVVWGVSNITTVEIAQHYKETFSQAEEEEREERERQEGREEERELELELEEQQEKERKQRREQEIELERQRELVRELEQKIEQEQLQTEGRAREWERAYELELELGRAREQELNIRAKQETEREIMRAEAHSKKNAILRKQEMFARPKSKIDIVANHKDPDIAEVTHHLRVAGRDFFTFCEDGSIDTPRSVREWIKGEAELALKSSSSFELSTMPQLEQADGIAKYGDDEGPHVLFQDHKVQQRYEIRHWQDHIQMLQKWWSPETMNDPIWEDLKTQLSRFTNPRVWHRWNVQRRIGEGKDEEWAYSPSCFQTPFHVACRFGLHILIDLELEKNQGDPSIYAALDGAGRTPFNLAATRPLTIKYLVEKGANVNQTSKEEPRPPLLIVLYLAVFDRGENDQYAETACYLISKGANINDKETLRPFRDATPLLYAAKLRNLQLVKSIIAVGDIDIDQRDVGGAAVLHYFFSRRPLTGVPEPTSMEMFKVLIEAGADINAQDNASRAPLSWAIEFGDEVGVKALLNAKNLLASDASGVVKSLEVDIDDKDEHGQTCLHDLASCTVNTKSDAAILTVLHSAGADFSIKAKNGETPLLRASRIQPLGLVQDFIKFSRDRTKGLGTSILQERDIHGRNILHNIAARLEKDWIPTVVELEDYFLEHGQKEEFSKLKSQHEAISGFTPLHVAARIGNIPMVRFLLPQRRSPETEVETKSGQSALSICIESLELTKPAEDETPDGKMDDTRKNLQQCLKLIFDAYGVKDADLLPLREVVFRNGLNDFAETLIEKNLLDLEARDEYGWNAYHIASLAGTTVDFTSSAIQDYMENFHRSPEAPSGLDPNRSGEGITLTNDGRGCSHSYKRTQLVLANYPIPGNKKDFYFEVTFENTVPGTAARCSIGLQSTATRLYDKMVGYKHGIGFHGDDGKIIDSLKSKLLMGFNSEKFGQHRDTVGCGIDLTSGVVFFTLNGTFLGGAAKVDKTIRYIPAASIRSNSTITLVNFGPEGFMFDATMAGDSISRPKHKPSRSIETSSSEESHRQRYRQSSRRKDAERWTSIAPGRSETIVPGGGRYMSSVSRPTGSYYDTMGGDRYPGRSREYDDYGEDYGGSKVDNTDYQKASFGGFSSKKYRSMPEPRSSARTSYGALEPTQAQARGASYSRNIRTSYRTRSPIRETRRPPSRIDEDDVLGGGGGRSRDRFI